MALCSKRYSTYSLLNTAVEGPYSRRSSLACTPARSLAGSDPARFRASERASALLGKLSPCCFLATKVWFIRCVWVINSTSPVRASERGFLLSTISLLPRPHPNRTCSLLMMRSTSNHSTSLFAPTPRALLWHGTSQLASRQVAEAQPDQRPDILDGGGTSERGRPEDLFW